MALTYFVILHVTIYNGQINLRGPATMNRMWNLLRTSCMLHALPIAWSVKTFLNSHNYFSHIPVDALVVNQSILIYRAHLKKM